MSRESTLTTPEDRDLNNKFRIDQTTPALTETQVQQAMQDLNVRTFPQVERRYVDPPLELQRIGLFSFVPAKGATPNPRGIYGFVKLRGNFATAEEADERAETLIRGDSYHKIYHVPIGRPAPLTLSSEFSQDVREVDLKKEVTESVQEDLRKKREKESREIEEIKQREKELLEDVKKTEPDRDDAYTTLRTKMAQVSWTYLETQKKMVQMCTILAKTRKEIQDMEREHPEVKNVYLDKYMAARRQAGLSTDRESVDTSFMKFLVEDAKIPEVDVEYAKLFGADQA